MNTKITSESAATASEPLARFIQQSAAEIDAIFRCLRKAKAEFGRNPDRNAVAITLIGLCILKGWDTRKRIVGALTKIGLDRAHVVITLRENAGDDPSRHLWQCDAENRYSLHD